MAEYYWEIETFDGTKIAIPPNAVEVVQRRMKNKEVINTTHEVIPANQIKSFRITDRRFSTQPLLEAAAQAFDTPMVNDEGDVQAKWVKKAVPGNTYQRHYAAIPAYRRLGEENGLTIIAYKMPIHLIDHNAVDECDENDIKVLTK